MIDLTKYYIDKPIHSSAFGSVEEVLDLPKEHHDQIHFLNEKGENFLREFLLNSKMFYGQTASLDGQINHWPFSLNYFKTILHHPEISKKWLFNLGIPFKQTVFILPGFGPSHAAVTTWKMIIKYIEEIEYADDHYIFDESLNWGLLVYHESKLYFGRDRIFDPEPDSQNTLLVNDILSDPTTKIKKRVRR